jgi:hypothetical protein
MEEEQKIIIHNEIVDLLRARKISPFDVGQILTMLTLNFSRASKWDEKTFDLLMDGLKPIYKKMLAEE